MSFPAPQKERAGRAAPKIFFDWSKIIRIVKQSISQSEWGQIFRIDRLAIRQANSLTCL